LSTRAVTALRRVVIENEVFTISCLIVRSFGSVAASRTWSLAEDAKKPEIAFHGQDHGRDGIGQNVLPIPGT
jgi:hypothetical protein